MSQWPLMGLPTIGTEDRSGIEGTGSYSAGSTGSFRAEGAQPAGPTAP